jgi:ABC-2 type transport system ATP-binding protein
MLRFDHVTKQYGHVLALDDLSMQVPDGAIYGFVGPNGAGKTTAIRLMCGLDFPDQGVVSIDDMEAGSVVRRMKRRFGYVPDVLGSYPNLRVQEYMDFFASCYELSGPKVKRRIQMLLDLVGLEDRQNQFMDSLSCGM